MSLTDCDKVRNRYAAASFAVDLRDASGLADSYIPEAAIEVVDRRRLNGRDAIVATLQRPSHNLHVTSNLWIRELSEASALCLCYMLLMDRETGMLSAYGQYDDQLVRCEDGEWRFARRRVTYLWTADSYVGSGQVVDSRTLPEAETA